VDVVTPVVMAAGMTVQEGTVLAESAVAQPALALKWERPAPAPSKLPELPRAAREPAADTASAAPLSLAEQPTEVQRDRPDLTVKVEIEAVLRALAPPLDLPSRAPVVEASAESDVRARSAPSAVDAPRLHPELSTAVPPARPEPVLGKGRARQASVGAMAAASRVASPKATPSPRIAEALLQVDADSGAMPILAPTGSVQPLPTAAATEVPRESVRPVTAGRAGDGPLPATVPRVTEPAPTAVPETWRKAAAGTLVGEAQWQAAERNIDVPRGALTHRAIGAPALPVMMPVAVPLVATDAAAGPAVGRPSESGLRAAPLAPARIGEALPSVAQTGVPRVPLDTAAASAVPTPHSMALATTGRSAALSTSQPAPVETGAPAPRASAVRTSAAIPVGDAMAVVVAADKASAAEPRTPLDTRAMAVVRAPQDAAVGPSVGVRPSVRVSSPAPPIGSSAPLVGPSVALPHQGAARALPETAIEASATVARGVRRQPVMSVAAPARVADPGLGDGVTERSNVSSGLAAVSISKATSAAPTGLAVGELRSSAPLAAPERSSAAGPLNMDVQSFGSAAPMVVESVVPREVVRRAMPSLVTAEIGSRPQSMSKEYMYRLRTPQKRREFIEELGGSEQTEQTVEEALAWLARAQSPDGRWDVDGFSTLAECGGGGDRADGDVAVTGLSLLAYLAAGYTRSEGAHKDTIRKGLDWLMAGQAANGDLRRGGQMYGQAMATAALCESVSLSADARLRDAAQRAVNFILAAQNPGLGWRYQPRDDDNDTSVVGWQVLALRSAQIAGITVPDKHYQWTGAWLDLVRKGSQGGLYSYKPGHGVTPVMTAEGWFCQLFMAGDARTRGEGESMAYVMANLPSWSTDTPGMIHFYYWYYGTLALHLSGAEAFEEWNAALTGALLAGRRKDGPSAGSWDPVCQLGPRGGRIYATAIATLCLEVYYRYLPLYRED